MSPLIIVLSMGLFLFFFSFISKRKHLLSTLLSLEGLMLIFFVLFYFLTSCFTSTFTLMLLFLVLTACEGALGLALLVSIVRSYGGDQFNSFNSLQC
uniref:NADH dehydrogenase subunit 4L n=1 Tax=Ceriodaphnia cornuta TaxID=1255123 RepID=UPI0022370C38|nr:NADH dehydrogenase subunit 4L [Ceriodaphnia cornuta]UYS92824.1 NADH dehydrogenase subunit 4L [Ceriodaphnia cornuta]